MKLRTIRDDERKEFKPYKLEIDVETSDDHDLLISMCEETMLHHIENNTLRGMKSIIAGSQVI